jgi:uncharacterized protein (DUF983 family)
MKYQSCCPKCKKPQSRWESFEPFIGFANQCGVCGADYKTSKLSSLLSVVIGLVIVGCFISADKYYIAWSTALVVTFILLALTIFASPYVTRLVEMQESKRSIMNKWMLPFLRGQILIFVFAIFLILANVLTLVIGNKSLEASCCTEERIEKIESAEKLKLVLKAENDLLVSITKLYKSLLKLNITLSFCVLFYLVLNLLFYFKIRDSQNKSRKK